MKEGNFSFLTAKTKIEAYALIKKDVMPKLQKNYAIGD